MKIYNGCTGNFIRDLDSQGLIRGPLGILQAPDGDILVISENNGRLIKYDYQTLSEGTVVMGDDPTTAEVEDNFIQNPVGAIMDDNGMMYVASFTLNSVVKVNTQNWTIEDEILPANNGYINGIDSGMVIGDDNELYLPGYYSNNIIKVNLDTKNVSPVVVEGEGGLRAPRAILVKENELHVAAERSNAIMIFDRQTGAIKSTLVDIAYPAALKEDGEGYFITNSPAAVFRIPNDGSAYEKIVKKGTSGLSAVTFVYRLQKSNFDMGDNNTDDNTIEPARSGGGSLSFWLLACLIIRAAIKKRM
ncbi:hypothetical protein [Pleionea sp. CnH1-48]|uniref:Vgb family protein n=1 Tax=Pleionea sp. CnH1-48 TaxID=2954494 RepID=UPI0020972A8A|nr:hypothetical protein [Pleionea sp. CnH1-48]MCO7225596.1 hypothetical protein [Pleionea sp. CnH1-48]